MGAGFFVAGSVFYVTRCFLLPVVGVAAVFSVAGKARFCVAAVFSVAANAGFSLAGLVFYVAALVFLLPERCVLLLLGVLCVRTVSYVAEMVFLVAATPAGTHEGSDVTSRCFVLPDFLAVSTRVPGNRISWLSREKTSRTKRCRAARLLTEHFGQAGAFSVCRLRGFRLAMRSLLTRPRTPPPGEGKALASEAAWRTHGGFGALELDLP